MFTGEDGKCFILEFCVLPEHRGGGMGTACARTLLNWAREQGAGYAELNCTTPPRQRFCRADWALWPTGPMSGVCR
ncbi:MAG: GNAT family N-acetyltransferase [Dysosmobacter sp.]